MTEAIARERERRKDMTRRKEKLAGRTTGCVVVGDSLLPRTDPVDPAPSYVMHHDDCLDFYVDLTSKLLDFSPTQHSHKFRSSIAVGVDPGRDGELVAGLGKCVRAERSLCRDPFRSGEHSK